MIFQLAFLSACARSSADRVIDYGSIGQGFKSLRAHQSPSRTRRTPEPQARGFSCFALRVGTSIQRCSNGTLAFVESAECTDALSIAQTRTEALATNLVNDGDRQPIALAHHDHLGDQRHVAPHHGVRLS